MFRGKLGHMPISPTYSKTIIIPKSSIDENGHVNNVAYVQWMQDIAVEHYASIGGIEAQGKDSTWVIREHRVEILDALFVGTRKITKRLGDVLPNYNVVPQSFKIADTTLDS